MSVYSIFQIAGSALAAQSERMNVSASNIANADSAVGPDGQPYKARQVVFQMTPSARSDAVGGVRVAAVLESNAPPRLQYNPDNPLADARGYVTLPNVNVVDETVNMISASRSYQANIEVINTAKSLMAKTLTIGQ
ncbi:flagellar basal body rod protein FlgC [Castellaniella hirudinis]|uniref:flagellar basal body rod protein FlgC n=1 Tax=Castellaniella hirudinis TaxID=1144617 RepID=UPI0039C2717B